MRRSTVLLASILALAAPLAGVARADGPLSFTNVRLPGIDGSGTEPRITVAPDDTRYAATNVSRKTGSGAVVFRSVDEGQTWQKTAADPQQRDATIDVDVVAMQTGRVLASELDEAGLNFPSSVTDDGGKTWTETRGSTELADQDRQWFAVGPVDKKTGKPTVYLLYHNLGSGTANHNMFVATSTDGGATFGPPVPTTVPGQTAYADLQCADSGGPSSIAVNQRTGRIYVVFTTRAGNVAPGLPDFGGCAAQPLEFNIVNATRVWVATSPDGSLGSWTQSLAVDDSSTGQIVSMQLAYGALDNQGGVYVAYPESPKPYPDLTGAAVKLRYQKPAADGTLSDAGWSAPTTLVPPSDSGGSTLVHVVAGDPGNVAVAYYRGVTVAGQDKPVWYTHVVHSRNVLSGAPEIVDQRVSGVPAYKWTASEMMGICGSGPAQGVENGLACDRSTDVWGVALDRQCRLSVVWPVAPDGKGGSTEGVAGHAPGTYVSTQSDAAGLCPSGNPPAAAAFLPARASAGCGDRIAPQSRVRGHVTATRRRLRFSGRATDAGCGHQVRTVRVSVSRRLAHQRCRFLLGNGRFSPPRSCKRTSYLPATGRGSFRFARKLHLPKGRYVIWTRAIDAAGNVERKARTRNLARFRVR